MAKLAANSSNETTSRFLKDTTNTYLLQRNKVDVPKSVRLIELLERPFVLTAAAQVHWRLTLSPSCWSTTGL